MSNLVPSSCALNVKALDGLIIQKYIEARKLMDPNIVAEID